MSDSKRIDSKPFLKRGISMADVQRFDDKHRLSIVCVKKDKEEKPIRHTRTWYDNLGVNS